MDHIGYDSRRLSLLASLKEFAASGIDYLKARINLAALEAKEAGSHIGITLAMAIGALVLVFFAYIFLMFGLVAWLATIFDGSLRWLWAALITAGLHLVIAGVLSMIAFKRIKRPVFSETINQMKKDQTWLHQTKTN